jgi:glycosyltransferase involved in cell wall biosynthesis
LCEQTSFDAIHIEGIEMAPYVVQSPKSNVVSLQSKIQNPKSKIIYDAHNAEYLLQRRAFTTDLAHVGRWHKALYSLAQWWRLRRFERQVCLESNHVLVVSQADKKALARLAPGIEAHMRILPNGVGPAYWSRAAEYASAPIQNAGDIIVFDGSMDFRPNVDAVRWFAGEVWPIIRAKRPDARFYIVGRNPTREVQALASVPGVSVTGAVDDPRSWVAAATVYVVPMRMGGGVRLKVLQAMAMGCALVSTPMGVEGIEVAHGKDVVIARSPHAFAEATISLLSDPQRRAELGLAAREMVTMRYAWPTLLPALDSIYPRS